MKVLIIEDDRPTADFIAHGLQREDHLVDLADEGELGLKLLCSGNHDVAVVDIMLPKKDGFTLIEEARAAGVDTPVLILSARSSVTDRVAGLRKGGDDYLVKPFAFPELLARLESLHRRHHPGSEPTDYEVEDLQVDLAARKAFRAGRQIHLAPLEFSLLEYLLRNQGRLVTRFMIMESVWDYNSDPGTNLVETRICRLRDKVDRGYPVKLIHTVRGRGYVLEKRQ